MIRGLYDEGRAEAREKLFRGKYSQHLGNGTVAPGYNGRPWVRRVDPGRLNEWQEIPLCFCARGTFQRRRSLLERFQAPKRNVTVRTDSIRKEGRGLQGSVEGKTTCLEGGWHTAHETVINQ
ncbi:unnamed protein product [Allacma fusca]|uniref:Uncharacterized protein n=1 Tax=Allacma fusca TaxID=39272 RepID=A0A8J2JVC2_9HEXA|nr:unnamed protein product [Allacma fusca]